jgi:hypothetical protein
MALTTWLAQTTLPGRDQKSEPPVCILSETTGSTLKTSPLLCRISMISKSRRNSSPCSQILSRSLQTFARALTSTWTSLGVDRVVVSGSIGGLQDRMNILNAITTVYKTIKRAQHESRRSTYLRRLSFRSWNLPPIAVVRAWPSSPSTNGPGIVRPCVP